MTSLQLVFVLAACLTTLVRGQRVQTEYGTVVGQTIDVNLLHSVVPVTSFYGIPFAAPPEGPLRFEAPQKHGGWSGDFIASELPNACMQNLAGLIWMTHPGWTQYSEDCLNLNIYKPLNAAGPLPVLVWFHGGAYTGGGNVQYPGHTMAARDVIVVTVNYRLGVFGFSSSRERLIPGNMGLLDQRMALEFVRDNIANFGGNPNKVTIYGQSAGASSTALHMVSPLSKGLFHQGILESGAENNVWTLNYPPQDPDSYIFQVADNLGCTYATEAEMVACLKGVSANQLRGADHFNCTPGFFCQGFAPIQNDYYGFMPDKPIRLREQLGADSVPIISGATRDDGSLYTAYFIPEANQGGFTRAEFQMYLRERLVDIFAANAPTEEDYENAYQAMDWFYTPWPYLEDKEANRQAINKLLTDGAFIYAWDRNAKLNAEYAPTYTYIHSYLSENSTSFIPEWMGAPHEAELPYVWGYGYLLENPAMRDDSGIHFDIVGWVPADMTYANYQQTLWSNFAKYGNPTPTPVPDPFRPTSTIWPEFDINDNLKVLDLDETVVIKQNYRQPDSYFYTEYLEYISKHEVKREAVPEPRPVPKLQLSTAMFQEAITKKVYESVARRMPSMSHLSFEEFKKLYA